MGYELVIVKYNYILVSCEIYPYTNKPEYLVSNSQNKQNCMLKMYKVDFYEF